MLARLEVTDPQLVAAIDVRSVPVDRTGRIERRLRDKVVLWSIAASVSLVLLAIVGVPLLATALTPLVPYAFERKLGAAVATQARASLETIALALHSNAAMRRTSKLAARHSTNCWSRSRQPQPCRGPSRS